MKNTLSYDVVVIGAGPSGHRCAELLAQKGLKVIIIERNRAGGNCVQNGCMSTKALLASSKELAQLKKSNIYGVTIEGDPKPIWDKILDRKRRVVEKITKGTENLIKEYNAEITYGDAKINSPTQVETSSTIYNCKYLLIASGSEPLLPTSIPGIVDLYRKEIVYTSTEIQEITKLPKDLVIVGGGVIGCEFALVFAELGVKVTILQGASKLVEIMDEDISLELQKILETKGVKIIFNAKLQEFDTTSNTAKVTVDNKPSDIKAEKYLISIGRGIVVPNGAKEIGLNFSPKNQIIVDDFMETNIKNVFALGDVAGRMMLTHVAYKHAAMVCAKIHGKKEYINYDAVPSVIYTYPELAQVGKSEDVLRREATPYLFAKKVIQKSGRAIAESQDEFGLVKIMVDYKGYILGAVIVAPNAGELITQIALAIESGIKIQTIAEASHPHPTFSQMIHDVAINISYQLENKTWKK